MYLLLSRCAHGQRGCGEISSEKGGKRGMQQPMEPTVTGGWVEPDMDVSQVLLAAQAPGAQSWSRASCTEEKSVLVSQSDSSCAVILAADRTHPDDRVILVMIDCRSHCNSNWLRHDLQWAVVGRVLLIISWPCTSSMHKDCGCQERAEDECPVPSCQFMRTVLLAKGRRQH